jgi:hypothetical protein
MLDSIVNAMASLLTSDINLVLAFMIVNIQA